MNRIALLGLVLPLAGCAGFGDFLGNTSTYGTNPNAPVVNSENARRVLGLDTTVEPMGTEAGNVWPSNLPSTPSLQEFEKGTQETAPPPSGQAPFLPDHRQPRPGSSTPPGSNQPGLPPEMQIPPQAPPPVSNVPPAPPPGQPVQTQRGPGVTTGGTSGYQTLTTPQGQAIIVPNGNGTSTVIHPDGTVETIPTPR
ncbi:MAG: hypothetical protein JOZ58_21325 [Acetobacteraceae bacterium]|nr:hypothetical protein [Acetobacteraceae bacterium]